MDENANSTENYFTIDWNTEQEFEGCDCEPSQPAETDGDVSGTITLNPSFIGSFIEGLMAGLEDTVKNAATHESVVCDIADIAYDLGAVRCMIGDAYACLSPHPKKVIFNDPATIIIDERGGKRVAKCGHGDKYDPKMGIVVATSKYFGVTYDDIDKYEMVFRMISGMNANDISRIGGIMIMAAEAMEKAGID